MLHVERRKQEQPPAEHGRDRAQNTGMSSQRHEADEGGAKLDREVPGIDRRSAAAAVPTREYKGKDRHQLTGT
jgi:hypothetical protein